MKTKTIPLLFLFIALILGGVFFLTRKVFTNKKDTSIRAKVVTPKSSVSEEVETEKWSSAVETEKYETFVPLISGETLISTLTIDLNNDGYDDDDRDFDDDDDILGKVTVDDIKKFGMIPEFIGRLPVLFTLDALDKDNSLPKTIVYSLNPKDTEALATLVFSFYED